MAVATYTTDLQVFNDFETSLTYGEFTNWTAGRTQALDTDYPIQGSQHVSAILATASQGSTAVDYGSNITWTSGWNFFLWHIFLAPAAIDTQANGGIAMMVGSATSAYHQFNVGGSDVDPYPYGGWVNFVADPEVTPTTTVGTVTGYRWCGVGNKTISAVSKGSPQGVDVIRFGRGELRIAGGDSSNGYATFASAAAANDANTAKWGLLRAIAGGYQFKGLMILGYGAATEFTDQNTNLIIPNTEFVKASFNRIEVRNTSSVIDWKNISISSNSLVSRGQFEVVDNAVVSLDSCTFVAMDTFIFQSNTTVESCTFRNCNKITVGGASLNACLISNSNASVALETATLNSLNDCSFVSDGTGHAVDLGTVSSTQTMNWNSTTSGYAATNGSTGNEAILVNVSSGVTLTINVSGVASPSVYNTGSGTVVVSNDVVLTITSNVTLVGAEVRIYDLDNSPAGSLGTELAGVESCLTATYQYTGTGGNVIWVQIMKDGYVEFGQQITMPSSNQSYTATLVKDLNA